MNNLKYNRSNGVYNVAQRRKENNLLRGNIAYIYTLTDPRTNNVMYVGRTVDPAGRRSKHFTLKKGAYHSPQKRKWLEDLYENNIEPIFSIIQQCTCDDAHETEKRYILKYKEIFDGLLNRVR